MWSRDQLGLSASAAAGSVPPLLTAEAPSERWPGLSPACPGLMPPSQCTPHPQPHTGLNSGFLHPPYPNTPSQCLRQGGKGSVFIKILLFNSLFSVHEQGVTKLAALLSDPGWLSSSVAHKTIMGLTVGAVYLETRGWIFSLRPIFSLLDLKLNWSQCTGFVLRRSVKRKGQWCAQVKRYVVGSLSCMWSFF